MTCGDYIQLSIAIILFITFIVLVLNLNAIWKQYYQTQTLNQPLCAVKNLKVDRVGDKGDVIMIIATIMNSGSFVAKNASIGWESFLVENLKDDNPKYTKIVNWSSKGKTQITILPRHEFERWLIYIDAIEFNKMIQGYEKAVGITLTIEYQNMNNKTERYSCSYLITRMLSGKDPYEISLQGSKLEAL